MNSPGHVLIAEDDAPLRRVIARALEQAGFEVESVSEGDAALARAARTAFDVVLSDIQMPGGASGMEVLREMKRTQPETEVVIATGHGTMDIALECLRHGAFDLIEKPFAVDELVSTVRRAVEHRRLRTVRGLFEVSAALVREENRGRLPERIVDLACLAMDADDASLMLPDSKGILYVAHSNGFSVRNLADRSPRPMRGEIAGDVARAREPRILAGSKPASAACPDQRQILSSIVYPLVSGDRLLGVLNFNRTRNPRPFGTPDLERAGVLASQAMLALENTELLRRVVASEKLASIGQVAASIAHEVNNPICFIKANLGFVTRELETFETSGQILEMRRALSDAEEGALRIKNIVRDMQLVSRNDGASVQFDLNEPILAAVRITGGQLQASGKPEFWPGTGTYVRGNPAQLVQVFINLLVNAAHAMNGRRGSIRIETAVVGTNVEARVADEGYGIAPENRDRIFEPFFTTKPAGEGTGLGLGICREIVRKHGGEITVGDGAPNGTVFTVRIPAA